MGNEIPLLPVKIKGTVFNIVDQINHILGMERFFSAEHYIENAARSPHINALIITLLLKHLRSPEGDGSSIGVHLVVIFLHLIVVRIVGAKFSNVKVSYF